MASLLLPAPLRYPRYICDTCKSNLRFLPTVHATTTRTLGTASSPKPNITTRHASLQDRRNRAVVWPKNENLSQLSTAARPFTLAHPGIKNASSGTVQVPHRKLIALSGPDAAKFLQGLITNNVDPDRHSPFYAAFLDARGRVLWDVFIWVYPELVAEKGHWACYIEVDSSEVEALKKHLKRHKLRSKVQFEDEQEHVVWAAWGDASKEVRPEDIITGLQDPRAPAMYRFLMKGYHDTIGELQINGAVEDYDVVRYEYGIAEGPKEIPRESALPMECNIDLSSGIDFKKGCYVGQELTIRTKHTGVVRKRILPVHLEFPAPGHGLDMGTDIKQLDENGNIRKGRAAGKYIASQGGDNGGVGLALCRLEMMTSMKVSAEGGSWKPGMEFGIESGKGVIKVKPVLYDWFVLRERELWDKNRTRI